MCAPAQTAVRSFSHIRWWRILTSPSHVPPVRMTRGAPCTAALCSCLSLPIKAFARTSTSTPSGTIGRLGASPADRHRKVGGQRHEIAAHHRARGGLDAVSQLLEREPPLASGVTEPFDGPITIRVRGTNVHRRRTLRQPRGPATAVRPWLAMFAVWVAAWRSRTAVVPRLSEDRVRDRCGFVERGTHPGAWATG